MSRAAIYARYSSEKQAAGETIETQVARCRAFCEASGLPVAEVYVDEARSGMTEGGRESYARMQEAARAGAISVIVAYRWDRLGRSFFEAVRAIYELEHLHDVRVLSATEQNDPLTRNILLSVADDFSRRLASVTSDGMRTAAQKGRHCGGVAPYGYRTVQVDGHRTFEVDPEQGPVVRRIFEGYVAGKSLKALAHGLNDVGIPAPGGATWDPSAVYYILQNEVYRGWRIWNKTRKVRKPDGKKTYRKRPKSEWVIVEGAHPALVDPDLWQAVEEARAQRPGRGGGGFYSHYLLTGLVKCGECGGNFIVHAARGKKRGAYPYYRCGYHMRRGAAVCTNGKYIPKEKLEGWIVAQLREEILTEPFVTRLVEHVRAEWIRKTKDSTGDAKRLQKEIRQAEKEVRHLVDAVKKAGLSSALQQALVEAEGKKAALEARIEAAKQKRPESIDLPSEREIADDLKEFREILDEGDPQKTRTLIRDHIEKIVVEASGEIWFEPNQNGLWCGIMKSAGNPYQIKMPQVRFRIQLPSRKHKA